MKFQSLHAALTDYLSEAHVKTVEKLTEAILDGHSIQDLGDISFLAKCNELGYLSLNKCDVRKLSEFPSGTSLERLEICDNKLHDGLDSLIHLDNLEELHLGGNKFESMDQLKPLGKLKNLRILDLTDCPVVEKVADLQSEIFKLIPTLEAFNGKDSAGDSVDFEDGSSDLDDFSDEDSEGSEDDEENDEEEDDEEEDADDDDEDEDEDDQEEDGESRPRKTARHD